MELDIFQLGLKGCNEDMGMKVGIHNLARIYAKGFYNYLNSRKIVIDEVTTHEFFAYCIKTICGVEAIEYNKTIRKYGDDCIQYLRKLKGTPKDLSSLTLEEKSNIINLGLIYVIINY